VIASFLFGGCVGCGQHGIKVGRPFSLKGCADLLFVLIAVLATSMSVPNSLSRFGTIEKPLCGQASFSCSTDFLVTLLLFLWAGGDPFWHDSSVLTKELYQGLL